jgi:pimeloyl-ACP methyl ester carboxylesterase
VNHPRLQRDGIQPTTTEVLDTPDGAQIGLTRFNGGAKGPVMVVHGVSVWSGMFTLPTVEENFVQFLTSRGYDVWLLDWRASIRLPLIRFTLDEAAENDFPTAVKRILERTGKKQLQAVVHCVGSMAFFMSLASGFLDGQVRCVASSQVALHPTVGQIMKLKAVLGLGSIIDSFGIREVSPVPDPNYPIFSTTLAGLVNVVHHECGSTVCHRTTFMFGHLYPHDTLNLETHDRLDEELGPCNLTTLLHLQQAATRGYLSHFDYGRLGNLKLYDRAEPPSYVDDASHLRMPMRFVSGALNAVFLPVTTQRTIEWLKDCNGPNLYSRAVIPHFGHWDNFVGAHANQYCYPQYLKLLEMYPV